MNTKAFCSLFLILWCWAVPADLPAQQQAFTRAYYPEVPNILYLYKIKPAPNGGFFAAGDLQPGQKIVVARFDAQGNLLWAKTPGDQRSISNLMPLKDGGVLVFNNNRSLNNYFDASVLHLGPDGSFIDETVWGKEESIDRLYGATRLASGEILAIGTSSEDGTGIFMMKFSDKGAVIWSKNWETGGLGTFSAPIEAADGGFYTTNGSALCRFDTAGNFLWGKSYDFGTEDGPSFGSGIVYPDGSLLFAAATPDNFDPPNSNVLIKLKTDGRPDWTKVLSAPNSLDINSMSFNGTQSIVVSGVTNNQYPAVTDHDNVIIRLTPDGKKLSAIAYGTKTQDFPFDSYFSGEYLVSCGYVLDGPPYGPEQTRSFISRSFLTNSACTKNFSLPESPATLALPTVAELTMTAGAPPPAQKRPAVSTTGVELSVQSICQSVGTDSEAPCPGLEPDVLRAASKNLNILLLEKTHLADAAHLRVFDCTGKTVLETRTPKAYTLEEKALPSGIYLYTLELKACGKTINVAGKFTNI
jgi:hypothetical protein